MRNLKNKKNDFLKIFITGGGSGIGKEVIFALFSIGYEVFVGVKFESEIALFQKIIIQNLSKIHIFLLWYFEWKWPKKNFRTRRWHFGM